MDRFRSHSSSTGREPMNPSPTPIAQLPVDDIDMIDETIDVKSLNQPVHQQILGIVQDLSQLWVKKKHKQDMSTSVKTLFDTMKLQEEADSEDRKQMIERIEAKRVSALHLSGMAILPPAKFSPVAKLPSAEIAKQMDRHFPLGKGKQFIGGSKPADTTIRQFLSELTHAQNAIDLSEPEFLLAMLSSCSGEAYDFLSPLVGSDLSTSEIYHNLLARFDRSDSPKTAADRLKALVGHKTDNLSRLQSQIMTLASQASLGIPDGPPRVIMKDFASASALISSRFVDERWTLLKLDAAPNLPRFIDLVKSISAHGHFIDEDLAKNGKTFGQKQSYALVAKTANYAKRTSNRSSSNNPKWRKREKNTDSKEGGWTVVQRRGNNARGRARGASAKRGSRGTRTRGAGNRPPQANAVSLADFDYCTLCGATSHHASQECWSMKNDKGAKIPGVIPVYDPCPACEHLVKKPLHHPKKYCIFRDKVKSFVSDAIRNKTPPIQLDPFLNFSETATKFLFSKPVAVAYVICITLTSAAALPSLGSKDVIPMAGSANLTMGLEPTKITQETWDYLGNNRENLVWPLNITGNGTRVDGEGKSTSSCCMIPITPIIMTIALACSLIMFALVLLFGTLFKILANWQQLEETQEEGMRTFCTLSELPPGRFLRESYVTRSGISPHGTVDPKANHRDVLIRKDDPLKMNEIQQAALTSSPWHINACYLQGNDQTKRIFISMKFMFKGYHFSARMLHDTGSDLTLLSETVLQARIPNWSRAWLRPTALELLSFSQHSVDILGMTKMEFAWPHKPSIYDTHLVYVISGDMNVLGRDLICKAQASLNYDKPNVRLHVHEPAQQSGFVQVNLLATNNHQKCTTKLDHLREGESKFIRIPLPQDVFFLEGQYVLFTNPQKLDNNCIIYPTRSQIEQYHGEKLQCTALVCNVSGRNLANIPVTALVGALNADYIAEAIPDNVTHTTYCKEWAAKYKLQREILSNHTSPEMHYEKHSSPVEEEGIEDHTETVSERYAGLEISYLVSELHSNEYSEPEFQDFDPEHDLSTAPHIPNPSQPVDQIVDLSGFEDDVKAYMSDIFLKRNPQVISRHSMDAGCLSKTLVVCYIKLESGKVLPEQKRLYRLSDPDSQHLYDILMYLQKLILTLLGDVMM